MSDYSEHLISLAGGDGDSLDATQRGAKDGDPSYHAPANAIEDRRYLLALAKDQQAKLDRIIEIAHWAGKRGWTIHPAEIRTALEAS